jgi:hypothetical protein
MADRVEIDMHVNTRWLRLPEGGRVLGCFGEIVRGACIAFGNTTISSALLANTRLSGVTMHLDLTDDENRCAPQTPDRDHTKTTAIRYRRAS